MRLADWISKVMASSVIGSCYQVFLEGYTSIQEDGTVSFTSHCNTGQIFSFSRMDFNKDVVLGKGSYGTVYRGTLDVAVKRVHQDHLDKREEEAMRELSHPNVIRLLETRKESEFK
jgi:serine/threonine protein kinase